MADVKLDISGAWLFCSGCGEVLRVCDHHRRDATVLELRRAGMQRSHRHCKAGRYKQAPVTSLRDPDLEVALPSVVSEAVGTPEQQWSRLAGLLAKAGLNKAEQAFFLPLEVEMHEFEKERHRPRAA